MTLEGKIRAKTTSLAKFAMSGKLTALNCQIGSTIKKGQLLAALETTELQTYLDRTLKQYDEQRAEFDAKQKQNLTEYEKRKFQDELDIAVKNVEIAKNNLNTTQLTASINGLVIEMDPAAIGDNITPAAFVITLIDPASFYFDALVSEENLTQIAIGQAAKITLKAFSGQIFDGQIEQISPVSDKNNCFSVRISLAVNAAWRLGLTGQTEI